LNHDRPDRLPRYEIFFPSFIEAWQAKKGLPKDINIHDLPVRIIGGDCRSARSRANHVHKNKTLICKNITKGLNAHELYV